MNKEEERIKELEEKLWQSQAKAGKAQEAVDKAQSTLRTVKDMGAAETVITAAEQAFEAAEADLAHAEEDITKAEEELKEAREVPEDETEELKDADGDQQPKKKGKAGLVIGIIVCPKPHKSIKSLFKGVHFTSNLVLATMYLIHKKVNTTIDAISSHDACMGGTKEI